MRTLQTGSPSLLRRQSVVCVVLQFEQVRPARFCCHTHTQYDILNVSQRARSIHDKLARSIESNRSSKSKNSWLSELIVYVLLFGTLLIIIIADYYIFDVMLWFLARPKMYVSYYVMLRESSTRANKLTRAALHIMS